MTKNLPHKNLPHLGWQQKSLISPFHTAVYDLPISLLLSVCLLVVFFTSQLVGVAWAASQLLPNAARLDMGTLIQQGSDNGTVISLSVLFTVVVVLAFIVGLIKIKKSSQIGDYLALRGFSLPLFAGFSGALLLLNVVIEFASHALGLNPMNFLDKLYYSAQPLWLLVVAMVVIAPIYEEVMFRGFMWAGLANRMGFWGASLITSVVFAMIHMQYTPIELVGIVALAMLFSYARAKSNSLLLPIALHIINNGLAMGLYRLGVQ